MLVISIYGLDLIACYSNTLIITSFRDFGKRHGTSTNWTLNGLRNICLISFNALIRSHNVLPTSDYLADSVDAFLTSNTESPSLDKPNTIDTDSPAIPLGLTFSFPVEQTALNKGFLLTWTKGFSAKNAINKDVVKLLQDAFDRKHLHVKCVALVNDVSLLVSPHSHERY